MAEQQKYRLKIQFTQETDGRVDNRTMTEEFSDDGQFHNLKTQVFTEELTKCILAITTRMTTLVAAGGETPEKFVP